MDVSDPYNPEEVSTYGESQKFLDIAIYGDYAYLADYNSDFSAEDGLRIVDVKNPAMPQEVAYIQIDDLKDIELRDNYLLLACGDYPNGFKIFDISNPLEPNSISTSQLDIDEARSISLQENHHTFWDIVLIKRLFLLLILLTLQIQA